MDLGGYLEGGGPRSHSGWRRMAADGGGWQRLAADGGGVLAPLKKIRGLDAAVLQAWRLGDLEAWLRGLEP